jgi:hypothetical protein
LQRGINLTQRNRTCEQWDAGLRLPNSLFTGMCLRKSAAALYGIAAATFLVARLPELNLATCIAVIGNETIEVLRPINFLFERYHIADASRVLESIIRFSILPLGAR